MVHYKHKVILQDDDERDRGAPQGQRETDCERWGNELKSENESTKVFCQHPWGQRRALSELTWAVVFQPFSPCSSPLLLFLPLSSPAVHMADSASSSPPVPSKWPLSCTQMLARAHSASLEPHLIYGSIVCDRPAGWSPLSSSSTRAQTLV